MQKPLWFIACVLQVQQPSFRFVMLITATCLHSIMMVVVCVVLNSLSAQRASISCLWRNNKKWRFRTSGLLYFFFIFCFLQAASKRPWQSLRPLLSSNPATNNNISKAMGRRPGSKDTKPWQQRKATKKELVAKAAARDERDQVLKKLNSVIVVASNQTRFWSCSVAIP